MGKSMCSSSSISGFINSLKLEQLRSSISKVSAGGLSYQFKLSRELTNPEILEEEHRFYNRKLLFEIIEAKYSHDVRDKH